jgi:type IV secretory pathway VirB3-like protein
LIAGIPIHAAALLLIPLVLSWELFHSLWIVLEVIPLWSFLKWHAKKEPLFLRFWAGQMVFKRYYRAG